MLLRGGTSKGVYFHEHDLPNPGPKRDKLLLRVMDSPARLQIDGLGGSRPITSKVGIVSRSQRNDADVDYTFAQVSLDRDQVVYSGNCGKRSMDPLQLPARTTALVLIDMQKGILSAETAPYNAEQIVDNAVKLGQSLHQAGGMLVRVHVGCAKDYADVPKGFIDKPAEMPSEALPTDFSEFAPEIAALPADLKILKRQWGAFYGTELDLQLRRRGVTTVILAGLTTSFGVETTAREGWQHNYHIVVAEDACTDAEVGLHYKRFSFSVGRLLRQDRATG